ncbi:two-component system, sporulation sensor kinase E [Paenibacillus sp. UNCCL117]|uniref:PAS domain S-box protein n=1 Tax=unclassified Paenibacillus TaxID=185978 RepID=UPI0008832A84|nr:MULTISPECIES: PAS domain S-box protein [unclassified Paenibacillus]SDE30320.1 two-component system, sporulation sensor kinase E [Paenibacillus sp. cl123]SFW63102.1 two-component system, sporulation sensor kinase E [Paenibacillus sp. UNCCL117]
MNDRFRSEQITRRLQLEGSASLEEMLVELSLKHFTSSHAGALLLDKECNLVIAGESLSRQLGYSPEQLQTMNLQALLHPGELLLGMHHLSQLLSGQLPRYEAEMRWIKADGEVIWMSVNAYGLQGQNHSPAYLYMQTQDITQRKRLEEQSRAALSQMSLLMEMLQDAYIMLSRSGDFVYVNKGAEKLLGHSRDGLLGHNLHTVLPEWINSGFYKQCMRSMEDATPLFFPYYLTMLGKWLEVSCYPSKAGLSIFMRDITAMREQEETLKAVKQQLNSMIEHTADNIAILDNECRLVQVNRTFLKTYGYTEQEIIGSRPPNVPDHLWIESELLFRQGLQGKQISGFETKRRRKDGTLLDMSLTISPVVGLDNEITGICIIGRDITERKKTEELLRNSEKLSVAGQLAAGVAHEIRNPLTALKGFTQFMKAGARYKTQYLDIMISELDRIEQIINELLILAKPQAVTFQNRPLTPILHHVLSLLESQANMTNIEFHAQIPDELPAVHCEENQLKQVFINILKNAMEAMSSGGRIVISAVQSSPSALTIQFADDGPGIPADVLNRLGEPFFTTKESGSGLGLMISQKIITEHNGCLKIESEPGEGTVVQITLPLT